jgi:hypothetical protein
VQGVFNGKKVFDLVDAEFLEPGLQLSYHSSISFCCSISTSLLYYN